MLVVTDVNIESPPSMHPPKRICDITGYEVSPVSFNEAMVEDNVN